jgi:X-Pro dipeptidyl-peptidase
VGRYGQVRWETLPHDYTFKKGHRIGLVIAGTDATYSSEPGTGANVTVDLARSSVVLPFVLDAPLAEVSKDRARFSGPQELTLPEPEPGFSFF